MRENRSLSTCEDSSHPLSLETDPAMAKSKDSAMQRQQLPSLHAVLNQTPVEAKSDQLPPRDHSILPFG
jgi:hypothetical protein